MSNSSWKEPLSRTLATSDNRASGEPVRLAILGVGNELNGDDAAGIVVVRALKGALGERPRLLLVEAGPMPENFSGPLRRFAPGVVLIIDAAHLGEAPAGSVHWIEWSAADGLSASTHSLPLSVLAAYLIQELGCQVALLGIQAQQLELGEALSPPVGAAVKTLAQELAEMLQKRKY